MISGKGRDHKRLSKDGDGGGISQIRDDGDHREPAAAVGKRRSATAVEYRKTMTTADYRESATTVVLNHDIIMVNPRRLQIIASSGFKRG